LLTFSLAKLSLRTFFFKVLLPLIALSGLVIIFTHAVETKLPLDICLKTVERSYLRTEEQQTRSPALIWSIPGSGNTWFRFLIESATGIYTGSVYNDHQLAPHLPGEYFCDRQVSGIKAHPGYTPSYLVKLQYTEHGMFWNSSSLNAVLALESQGWSRLRQTDEATLRLVMRFYQKCEGMFFDRALVIVRDPFDAIWSEYQRLHGKRLFEQRIKADDDEHTHVISIQVFNATDFEYIALLLAEDWRLQWQHYRNFLDPCYSPRSSSSSISISISRCEARLLAVRYEDLADPRNRVAMLQRALDFLEVPRWPEPLECAFWRAEALSLPLNRKHTQAADRMSAREAWTRAGNAACRAWSIFGADALQAGYTPPAWLPPTCKDAPALHTPTFSSPLSYGTVLTVAHVDPEALAHCQRATTPQRFARALETAMARAHGGWLMLVPVTGAQLELAANWCWALTQHGRENFVLLPEDERADAALRHLAAPLGAATDPPIAAVQLHTLLPELLLLLLERNLSVLIVNPQWLPPPNSLVNLDSVLQHAPHALLAAQVPEAAGKMAAGQRPSLGFAAFRASAPLVEFVRFVWLPYVLTVSSSPASPSSAPPLPSATMQVAEAALHRALQRFGVKWSQHRDGGGGGGPADSWLPVQFHGFLRTARWNLMLGLVSRSALPASCAHVVLAPAAPLPLLLRCAPAFPAPTGSRLEALEISYAAECAGYWGINENRLHHFLDGSSNFSSRASAGEPSFAALLAALDARRGAQVTVIMVPHGARRENGESLRRVMQLQIDLLASAATNLSLRLELIIADPWASRAGNRSGLLRDSLRAGNSSLLTVRVLECTSSSSSSSCEASPQQLYAAAVDRADGRWLMLTQPGVLPSQAILAIFRFPSNLTLAAERIYLADQLQLAPEPPLSYQLKRPEFLQRAARSYRTARGLAAHAAALTPRFWRAFHDGNASQYLAECCASATNSSWCFAERYNESRVLLCYPKRFALFNRITWKRFCGHTRTPRRINSPPDGMRMEVLPSPLVTFGLGHVEEIEVAADDDNDESAEQTFDLQEWRLSKRGPVKLNPYRR
jgi:hypothetical protein